MAGNGPAPNPNRRRRNADVYSGSQTVVTDDGELRGPALTGTWSEHVRSWYDTWRRSPQAAVFTATDWMRLRMLAPLVDDYLERPHHMKLAEIRQNESLLGATHTDRLKARIKVEQPAEAEAPAGVTALDDYRRALGA
jgi:hypothetical protein